MIILIKYPDGLVLACLLVLPLHDHHPPDFVAFFSFHRPLLILGGTLLSLKVVSYVHSGSMYGRELVLLNYTCILLVVCVEAFCILRAAIMLTLQLLFLHLREHFGELTGPALKLYKVCRSLVFCLPDVLVSLLT